MTESKSEPKPDCGTGPCMTVVDRLSAAMTSQQKLGFQGIERLMQAHHEELKGEISEIKRSSKDMGDEIFPRLRKVETGLELVGQTIADTKASQMTEAKVKEIIDADERIIAWNGTRKWTSALLVTVSAGVIIESITWIVGFFKAASHGVGK